MTHGHGHAEVLADKVAIVTGGGSGIGAACARALAESGASVVISDINIAAATAVADEIGAAAVPVEHDVTSAEQWETVVEVALSRFGRLTTLVNNAGISRDSIAGPDADLLDVEAFRKVVEINLIGTFLGLHAAMPALRDAGSASVINMSSAAGLVGTPGELGYTASKFGVRGLAKAAALTFGAEGVRVNSVHPGVIKTPMVDNLSADTLAAAAMTTALGRLGDPREVANIVVYLASDQSSFSTGSEFIVDGGWTAV